MHCLHRLLSKMKSACALWLELVHQSCCENRTWSQSARSHSGRFAMVAELDVDYPAALVIAVMAAEAAVAAEMASVQAMSKDP